MRVIFFPNKYAIILKNEITFQEIMAKNLISMLDVKEDINEIIKQGLELKNKAKNGENIEKLKGKTLGMIFEKSSTRTRASFEAGMTKLGGHAIFLSNTDIQLGRGETIEDTAIVLSRYVDIIMYRSKNHKDMKELADNAKVPVINGLDNKEHPCQVITDLMTIKENKGTLKGLNPEKFFINEAEKFGVKIEITDNLVNSGENADIIATDTWISMGDESEKEMRIKDFQGYTIDSKIMEQAKNDSIFLHCLPAYYGYEVTKDVAHGVHSVIFDEAENRMWAQMAIILYLLNES